MKDISEKNLITLLEERLLSIENQFDTETQQIADFRHMYDDSKYDINKIIDIDKKIIRSAEVLGEFISGSIMQYDDEMKNTWMWNPDLISRGEYPIDKLPDHVKDLAKELYYK